MHPMNNQIEYPGCKNPKPTSPNIFPAINVSPKPNNNPITPAMNPNMLDSNKNILNISEFLAPIDFKTPISFILSRTDVIIVFDVFIAETKTEINAMRIMKPITIFNAEE